jgi:hypothetical protein
VSGGRGKAAAVAVLSAFSWRKLWKLGRPGNGEVVLSGGALVEGMSVGIDTARGGAEAGRERKKKKERRSSFRGVLQSGGGVAAGTVGR